MSSDTLLTDLCSVCYTDKPKYRCPRCKTRSCSLACSKKHKQRASCSGVRDPAEYLKKNELATPAGVDRDYNYLKSVERSIEVANRDAEARGIDVDDRSQRAFRGYHPESILQKYLVRNNITVHRAPTGMTRQKTNNTRSSKRNHIMWTVEWVTSSENRRLSDNCYESASLYNLYLHLQSEKRNTEKRKIKEQKSSGHSKRAKNSALSPSFEMDDQNDKAEPNPRSAESVPTKAEADEPLTGQASHKIKTTNTDIFFYLLRTGTSSTSRVLIPLDGTANLTESLRDQTVLEYPTIYVLPNTPDSLPSEFSLEGQYFKSRNGEENGLDEAVCRAEDDRVLPEAVQQEVKVEFGNRPDPYAILAMLKRDVTR